MKTGLHRDNTNTFLQNLVTEMKSVFGTDQKRIDHALEVFENAMIIHKAEGGDIDIVRAAAILHDIGIQAAERKHGSSAGKWQELEGPPIARKILEKLNVDSGKTEHVCRIVGSHHSASDIDTIEFRILWDADWLVNFPEIMENHTKDKLSAMIGRIFKTPTGTQLAGKRFLHEN